MVQRIYNVSFKNLGIELKINPIALNLGNIKIYWYGIIIALGFICAYTYVLSNAKKFNLNKEKLSISVLTGMIFGLIGARLYYVIFYPGNTYINDPMKIFYINQGGIAIYGGLIFGIISGLLMAKRKNLNLLSTLDICSLGLLIGQSIGRWGNFFNQEAFGSTTDSIFAMSSEATFGESVHPCFLYESFWCLLGFIFLHIFKDNYKQYKGQIFLIYLLWYGVGRIIIEKFRTDSLFIWGSDIKISQLISFIVIILSIVFLLFIRRKTKKILNQKNRGEYKGGIF